MVDILMATYNGADYLSEQIDSIIGQTVEDWRLLISDDCSNDGTLQLIDEYCKADSRICLVSHGKRYGSARDNFISLAKHATSEYVMFCDQDDVWLNRKIEITLRKMRELEEIGSEGDPCLVFTDLAVVDSGLEIMSESFTACSHIDPSRTELRMVLAQSIGAGCTMMLNKPLVELFNEAEVTDRIVMHDWWATLLASAFGRIAYVSETTVLYRQHGSNAVGAVKYNPAKSACNVAMMVDSVRKTVGQASLFYELYSKRLKAKERETVKAFCGVCGNGPLSRELSLIKSGCWKKGARKLGQIIAVWKMGMPDD